MSLNDYKREKLENHILTRPDTYIGGCDAIIEKMALLENNKIVVKEVEHIPGLLNIYDEIIVNARDHMVRLEQINSNNRVTNIKISIDEKTGLITIYNDGEGIDVADHPTEKDENGNSINIVHMILFDLLTSKNYNENEKKIVGGKNGYGAKLTNIFSTFFRVETVDSNRGLKYVQEAKNNKKVISKAKITKTSQKSYTKISWIADFQRFAVDGYTDTMINIMKRRAYDLCGVTNNKVNIYLNNTKLKIKNFADYTKLYSQDNIITETSERWEIGILVTDEPNENCSFVNGIMTMKGGKHVDYVMKECVKKLKTHIEKKIKKSIADSYIKNYLQLFVNSVIENPSFDSQTKERLITPASKFGSKPNITDKFIKQIIDKTNIIDRVLKYNEFKLTKENKKTDGKKKNKIYDIPKLDDANWAGTKKSDECILILTEGDSAKSMAVAGLSVVGRDKFGVFPLKGKVMNVRDSSKESILKNQEVTNLKKIIGLEGNKVYNNTKSLRYGKIMIMTDQDHDGSHIKGLVMNVFHVLWPSLLEIGYITCMLTPIIKVSYKKNVQSFYTLTDYEQWKNNTKNYNKWNIKYYKGLGTSNSQEAREYFSNIKINNYIVTKNTDESMYLAFDRKYADKRKIWLYKYDRKKILDHNIKNVNVEDFINKELIHFSNNDTERSIGSVFDGLKPSQRKILYSCLKRKLYKEIRVAQLAGYVSENSAYHHGEASLQGAIIAMAQNFVGTNNINLLMPNGQFGTRIMGGSDSASSRYIHTELNPIVNLLFPSIELALLEHNYDDGIQVEPKYYLPIIPLVLVNGMLGIGTGFSTSIPQFSPKDIIQNIIHKLTNKPYNTLTPYYKGFKGKIIKTDSNTYISKGIYKILDYQTLEITELPIGKWTDDYKKFLDSLLSNNTIIDYTNNSTDYSVHFIIKVEKSLLNSLQWSDHDNIDDVEKMFKLTNTKGLSTSNMHLYDKLRIKKFNDIYDIFDIFIKERLILYKKRIKYQCTNYKNKIDILNSKIRFIEEVMNEDIIIFKRKRADIINDLIDMHYPTCDNNIISKTGTYDYLLKIQLDHFTEEEITKLNNERDKNKKEYLILSNKTPEKLWIQELNALSKYL